MNWRPEFGMRLRSATSLFGVLLLMVGCGPNPDVSGSYQFEKIVSEGGKHLLPVAQLDSMNISDTGGFSYYLEAKNHLFAQGTWKQVDLRHLEFHYHLPIDTTRYYRFAVEDSQLVLTEGPVNFSFIKK